MVRQPLPQAAVDRHAFRQRRVFRHGAFDAAAGHIIQFAIDQCDQHGFVNIGHAASPISSMSAPRPRTSRDVSVPVGTPSTAAASL